MACEVQKSKPTRHLTTPDRCILHTWRCRELSRVIPPTSVKRSAARVRPFPPRQPRWSPHGLAPAYAQTLAAESLRPCVSDGGRRLRGDLPRSASARSRTSGQRPDATRDCVGCSWLRAHAHPAGMDLAGAGASKPAAAIVALVHDECVCGQTGIRCAPVHIRGRDVDRGEGLRGVADRPLPAAAD